MVKRGPNFKPRTCHAPGEVMARASCGLAWAEYHFSATPTSSGSASNSHGVESRFLRAETSVQ